MKLLRKATLLLEITNLSKYIGIIVDEICLEKKNSLENMSLLPHNHKNEWRSFSCYSRCARKGNQSMWLAVDEITDISDVTNFHFLLEVVQLILKLLKRSGNVFEIFKIDLKKPGGITNSR